MLCLGWFNKLAAFAAVLTIAASIHASQAMAQASEEDWQLFNRIAEASNTIGPETAREGHKLCVELGKEIAARTDMPAAQRLYFEAEIESCIAYAMNNGQYSDETGDECSHHFLSARLMAEAIKAAQDMPGVAQEWFTNLRDRLQRASELGPQLGCKGDYAELLASLPAADAIIAATPRAGLPDDELMVRFEQLKYGITAEGPEQWLAQCRALSEEVERLGPTFHEVERWYFLAQVEDCIARTMAMSGFSDDTGNACTHHHAFAQSLSVALLLNKDMPFFEDNFRQFMAGELATAMRQGPGMGCAQDYEVLKID